MTMASGSRSINEGSDGLFQNECDVCLTQGITSEGISYCTICYENLCQRCEQSHRGSRATRDHTLVTGSAVTSGATQTKPVPPIMLCDTHKTSMIEFICDDHDELICVTCKMANHTKCRTADLSHQVKQTDIHGTLKVVTKELVDLSNRFKSLQKTRQTDKSTLNAQFQKCLKDLKRIRKDVNNRLDKLEGKLTTEIQGVKNKISKKIDEHDAISKSVLVQIDDLNKLLLECQKSKSNDTMFIGMKKASSCTAEFEKIIVNIQEGIYPIDIRIEPNDILTDLMDQLQTIGTLVTDKQTGYSRSAPTSVPSKAAIDKQVSDNTFTPKSLLNIEVIGKGEKIDLKLRYPLGCVFMADGHLVVACYDGLKLYDKDCRYKSQLNIVSWNVAVIDDTTVVLPQGSLRQLQCVRVLPDMKVVKTVKMDRVCSGVDVCGDELYVTCHDGGLRRGNGEVRVLTMDGNVLRRLGVNNGKYMFTSPDYVKVSKTEDKVFVSDCVTHTITCLSTQGRILYKYTDKDLNYPRGMYVDKADNLFVCGGNSHNVHVIRHDGRSEKILLTQKDGIEDPQAILYRPQDGCLAVVIGVDQSQLLTFTTRT